MAGSGLNIPRLEDMLQIQYNSAEELVAITYNPQELYDILLSLTTRLQQAEAKIKVLQNAS